MIVQLGNVRVQVVAATAEEEDWLTAYLGVPDEKAKYRTGNAPASRPLYSRRSRTFPAGLLGMVRDDGKLAGFTVQVRDMRARPCAPDPRVDLTWLTDFQQDAVEHGFAKQRGVFHCGTGAGKTEIMVALGAVLPCEQVVFVHRVSLLKEIGERFERRTGERAGSVGGGVVNLQRFTVAMFQTVHRAVGAKDAKILGWLARCGVMHVDEGHTLPSATFWQVTVACSNAFFRYAYSATPFARADHRGMLVVAATGPVLYRVRMSELVDQGIVARGSVRLVRYTHRGKGLRGGQLYADAYAANIVANPARNTLVVETVRRAPKPLLLFVRVLEHGKLLAAELNAAGVSSEFLWGAHNVAKREAAVHRLEHGDIEVIVANVIFQEGVNIPSLRTVVSAAGGKSEIAALQNAGRGSRRRDREGAVSKEEFVVYDIADTPCAHCGLVGTEGELVFRHRVCQWFARHTRARHASYLAEGYAVLDVAGASVALDPDPDAASA
jgi:superfamily II DNA or RNA helicase